MHLDIFTTFLQNIRPLSMTYDKCFQNEKKKGDSEGVLPF